MIKYVVGKKKAVARPLRGSVDVAPSTIITAGGFCPKCTLRHAHELHKERCCVTAPAGCQLVRAACEARAGPHGVYGAIGRTTGILFFAHGGCDSCYVAWFGCHAATMHCCRACCGVACRACIGTHVTPFACAAQQTHRCDGTISWATPAVRRRPASSKSERRVRKREGELRSLQTLASDFQALRAQQIADGLSYIDLRATCARFGVRQHGANYEMALRLVLAGHM